MLARYTLLSAQADGVKAEADRAVATAREIEAEQLAPLEAELRQVFAALKTWWAVAGAEIAGKRRSAELAGVEIGIRRSPAALKLPKGLTMKALIQAMLGKGLIGWLRIKYELDRPGIGDPANPAAGTLLARNEQLRQLLANPLAVTQSGTWTVNLGSLNGAATNANGTLYSALDIYVTRASSVTAPTMRSLSGAISVASRWAHGMTDGTLVSFAVYFQCAAFGTQQTLINLWRQTNLPFQLFVLGNGQLRIVSTNSAGTQSIIASTGVSLGIGTPRWLFGTINTATGAVVMYLGDNPVTMSGTLSTGTLSLGDCNPIFLASSARNQLLEPGSPFVGGTGAGSAGRAWRSSTTFRATSRRCFASCSAISSPLSIRSNGACRAAPSSIG